MLKVFIIEEHTEALEVLCLGVRRKMYSLRQLRMIHFDSHPDLSCASTIRPDHIHDRTELCHLLRNTEDGISSFILPALSMGLLNDVVWVRPPWTTQIPDGAHQLTFGWACEDDECKLSVATELDYWKGDGNAVDASTDLQHTTTFTLRVTELNRWLSCEDNDMKVDLAHSIAVGAKRKHVDSDPALSIPWVLDICLDYFSCANPLQEPDLPEHISTAEEISQMIADMEGALTQVLQGPTDLHPSPALCIIARSELDGFTPGADASNIESLVLAMLRRVYGEIKVYPVPSFEVFYDPAFIRSV